MQVIRRRCGPASRGKSLVTPARAWPGRSAQTYSEDPLQAKLDKPWVPSTEDLAERASISQVAIWIIEVGMVKEVEILIAELDLAPPLGDRELLEEREVEVDESWAIEQVPC